VQASSGSVHISTGGYGCRAKSSPVKENGSVRHQEIPTEEAGAKAAESEASDEWTQGQEVALLKAMKEFPKDDAQRWGRIAEAVPGKGMNQCKKHYGSLLSAQREQKGKK
ncbi:hypothetical protein CYMTET_16472, partial [Cymbomonas tetramitiformis]